VGVVMGSKSDYEVLSAAVEILRVLKIPHEARIVSAHRTPDWLFKYAETARERGLRTIIAGAGGAAHLPGMLAAKTLVPVLVQNARDSDPNLSVVARSLLLEIDPMAARKVAIQMAIQDGADKFYRKWVLRLRE